MSCTIKFLITHLKENACLALIGAIRGTSKGKIYQELAWSLFKIDAGVEKILPFYKVLENENPKYLFSLIPARRLLYLTGNILNIPLSKHKTQLFQKLIIIIES